MKILLILFFFSFFMEAKYHEKITEDFWKEGVGAFTYFGEGKDIRMIILLPTANNKFIPHRLYLNRSDNDWNKKGDVKAWDGNKEFPVLKGSIKTDYWHGFIKKGQMVP